METSDRLDTFDTKLLQLLQTNGRMSIVELASHVGLSKSPCLKRMRKLERTGYIRGYRADIAPKKVHQSHVVYVQVTLSSTKMRHLEEFNAAVLDVPQIVSCAMMTGGFDYLLKVRTRNMRAYRELLGDVIASLPGVHQTSTFPVIEEVKDTSYIPLDEV